MRIAVAMSGGVDSSVVAKMLVDEGHEVVGLFLKLWTDPTSLEGLPSFAQGYGAAQRGTGSSCHKDNRCCNYEALEDARKVANQLGIPFYVINATEAFKKAVVDNFLAEYKSLRTPNPCIVCNDKIKFDLLLKKALSIGCEKLATGHYARIKSTVIPASPLVIPASLFVIPAKAGIQRSQNCIDSRLRGNDTEKGENDSKENNETIEPCNHSLHLFAGIDDTKDQSYMLYRLNQKQLAKILFPLGKMTKKEVRALASEWDLPVKEKPESQEICFVNDDYRSFLKRYLPETFVPGDIVDKASKVVGKHEGLINYTIGQRKGIEQDKILNIKYKKLKTNINEDRVPLYVVGFNAKKNQLIVGEDQATYQSEMLVSDLHWIDPACHPEESKDPIKTGDFSPVRNDTVSCHPELVSGSIKVKIRYRHPAVPCSVESPMSKAKSNGCVIPTEALRAEGSLYNNKILKQVQDDNLKVFFKKPQRAITPGQSAVFYLGDQVLGGGLIFNK